MKKKNDTKRSLRTSAVSLLLCLAMLVGTTFAWFTDSISNKGNIIQSGNLDIGAIAYDVDANGQKQVTISGLNNGNPITFEDTGVNLDEQNDPIINEENWEPGISNAKLLEVTNNGSLATKIKLEFAVNDGGLQEALWFDFVMVEDNNVLGTFQKRPMSQLQTVADQVEIELATKQSTQFVLVYGMNEKAGNEYQGKSFSAEVAIIAKQDTQETDGFGNDQYDANAIYPEVLGTSLEDLLESAKPGDTLQIPEGKFDMPSTISGGVSIVGKGRTTQLIPEKPSNNQSAVVINQPGVKISNAYVRSIYGIPTDEYSAILKISRSAVLDHLEIEKTKGNYSSVVINSLPENEQVTINHCTMHGKFKAVNIVDGTKGTVNILNSEITGVYPISVNSSSSQTLTINVENSKIHGWTSYGDINSAKFVNTEFSKGRSSYNFIRPYANTTWENCTFDETFEIGAGSFGKTFTINNCTKAGVKITAENIVETGLLSLDGSDGEKLKGCTIVVNGTTVSLA